MSTEAGTTVSTEQSTAVSTPPGAAAVLRVADIEPGALARLLGAYGLQLSVLGGGESIPGSYWGESEAGLRGTVLYARADTPVHSVLHEASHFVCMSTARRSALDRDAGGDDPEECAVCYLQVLLAQQLAEVGRERMFADMDRWGYSFRLGDTRSWFTADAQDARAWLISAGVLDAQDRLTGHCRS